jgi:mRNA-degrading endonuclease RelE of RelBE toxin-antitoxin system
VTDAYWRVVVDDRARKDLRRIDPQIASGSCVPSRDSPQGGELAGDVKRLSGSSEYRLRVGDWRVRFERHDRRLTTSSCACSPAAAPTTAEPSPTSRLHLPPQPCD